MLRFESLSSNPGVTHSRSDSALDSLDRLVATLMRGGAVGARELANVDVDQLVLRAESHGVLPLVAERARSRADVPSALRSALEVETRRHAAIDTAREVELRRLLAALEVRGVRALLMKGAHLAYTHYGRPDLRPRIDTDLLVARTDRETAVEVLSACGYESTGHVPGTLVMYQACYVKRRQGVQLHVVDVHWKVANPQVFSDLVSYDELQASAVALPALGAGAWGLSDVHALLIACVHRVAHHYDAGKLIWLYDIHLIASRLPPGEWRTFEALCQSRGVARVCRRSLERASAAFGTALPSVVLSGLDRVMSETEVATAAFLEPGRRHVEQVVGDLRALPSWGDRARLVRQHVFPPASYMRGSYAPSSGAPLAVLYVRRALQGAWKWLARP
jgi:hypothetical protein